MTNQFHPDLPPAAPPEMPGGPDSRIRSYLLQFFSGLLCVVLLLGFFLWFSYRQTELAAEVALRNIATTVEARFDATLRRIEANLEHIAAKLPDAALDGENVAHFSEQVRQDLELRVQHFPELSSFRIIDADGNGLYNSGAVVPSYNVSDREYFQSAKNIPGKPLHYSGAIVGKRTDQPVIVMAKGLTDQAGNFRGVVIGALKMGYFMELFSTLNLGHSGVVALRRTDDGALLARWPALPDALNIPFKPDHPMRPWLESGNPEGVQRIHSQADGSERLYVFRRLERYPFFVIPGRTPQEYLTEWREMATVSIAMTGIALLMFAFLLRRQWRARQLEILQSHRLAEARDAAEAASRAKSTFLANMSHELRTPMNGIMGMASVALRQASDPKLRHQLETINHSSQHLLGVINDILDISKIEAGRLTLEQVDFRLGDLLENLRDLIGNKVAEKNLALQFDVPVTLQSLPLSGDPLRLGQILLNLSGNAVKFTEQGSVTVYARLSDETSDQVRLCCEIRDTGIGIEVEDQKRLFSSFEQADSSMTRKYGGTGLGLVISKRLVEMMGGEIAVESTPGQGSTFRFSVQLARGRIQPAETASTTSAEALLASKYAGARILIAEDEPINQEVSRGLLEDIGLLVDVADDGAEALALARQQHYALILMDMQMPKMNGVDATRAIRHDSLNTDTPILAMTANAFEEDRQTCLAAGMNDHIGKPVDPDRLFEVMLSLLKEPLI
ncbi:MAG: ATP-binding protein [Azonexus sp.]|nr:ATP-binding protein [Azonexus sp.]